MVCDLSLAANEKRYFSGRGSEASQQGADALLLDEPFSALDGELKEKIAALILEISRDKILVAVSHDTAEAQLFGARVIKL